MRLQHPWAFAVALALAAPASASAERDAPELALVKTSGFRMYLPAGWKVERQTGAKGAPVGTWVAASANRNGKAYIRVGHFRDEPLKALWLRFVEESLGKRVLKIHVQHYAEKQANEATGMAIGAVYGLSRRGQTGQIYKFTVFAVRNVLRHRIAYVAIGATRDRWREVLGAIPIALRSLDLR